MSKQWTRWPGLNWFPTVEERLATKLKFCWTNAGSKKKSGIFSKSNLKTEHLTGCSANAYFSRCAPCCTVVSHLPFHPMHLHWLNACWMKSACVGVFSQAWFFFPWCLFEDPSGHHVWCTRHTLWWIWRCSSASWQAFTFMVASRTTVHQGCCDYGFASQPWCWASMCFCGHADHRFLSDEHQRHLWRRLGSNLVVCRPKSKKYSCPRNKILMTFLKEARRVQGESIAQWRQFEAEVERDRMIWERRNAYWATMYGRNSQIESQQSQLHHANQWTCQAQMESRRMFEEFTTKRRL